MTATPLSSNRPVSPLSLFAGFAGDDGRDPVEEILAQWREVRPDLEPSPMGVFGRIARVHLKAQEVLQALLEAHHLTLESFDVLMNLRRSAPDQAKTSGELAASSMLTRAGMSVRLDRLEKSGLISRSHDEQDRRVVLVALSPAGLALIDDLVEKHLALESQLLGSLTRSEQRVLAAQLAKLDRSVRTAAAQSE